MASVKDVRTYFQRKGTESKKKPDKRKPNTSIIQSATNLTNEGELDSIEKEVEKSVAVRENYTSIPKHVRVEVGKYALVHGTHAAMKKFSELYPKFKFKRTTINTWKSKLKANGQQNTNTLFKKTGRPNLLPEELLKKTKDVIIGTRLAGTVISRRMVIAIGNGVVKANDPGEDFILFWF